MSWTPEQSMAIHQRKRNLLVSAAAGSGKTAVLVERILSLLINDGIDIDRLLIVTFTNAAAAEMKERIAEALSAAMEVHQEKEEFIRRQITLLNKASISTLHAFCVSVIRKNFYKLGIDPNFKIGETTDLTLLRREALLEVLEEAYGEKDEAFIELIESYSENKGDQKIEALLTQLYFFIQSQPDPYQWVENQIQNYKTSEKELLQSEWIAVLSQAVSIEISGIYKLLVEALAICEMSAGPEPYADAIIKDIANIEHLQKELSLFFEGKLSRADMTAISHAKLKSVPKDSGVDEVLQDKVKNIRTTYKDYLKKLFGSGFLSKDLSAYAEDLTALYPRLEALLLIIKQFNERYYQKKKEKKVLDFNDLEQMALLLLSDENTAESFRNQFHYIFIDEYQDSNIVQETIINYIKNEDNLFFVGDVKQSIYRFRLADPGLFIKKYETYTYDDPKDQRIDLSKNFRSRKEILDGVNYIFRLIMSKNLGEIAYTSDAYLYPGADYPETDSPEIHLHIIDKSETYKNFESDIDLELAEMNDAETEAYLVAEKIRSVFGTSTYDIKKKCYREIEYRDIVILLRSAKNWSPVFYETLTQEGFPVYVDDNSGYFETIEIKMFMNLLTVIDNKRNDLALLSVMRAPFFGFSSSELSAIRKETPSGNYFRAAQQYMEKYRTQLSEKIESMFDKIEEWNKRSKYTRIDDFLWELMLETGFYYLIGGWPGGSQRQANLKILVERAAIFTKSSRTGLFAFIKFAQLFQKASGDMGGANIIGENENVLRIMTIHKSKGLEFPVVILAGVGRTFNTADTKGDLLLHKTLGLGIKYVDPERRIYRETLPRFAIKAAIKTEGLSEEMRVLYVAMTRAKDQLILIGTAKDIEKSAEKWSSSLTDYQLLSYNSYLDWIGSCLIRHPDGEALRESLSNGTFLGTIQTDSSKWKIMIHGKMDLVKKASGKEDIKEEIKNELLNFSKDTNLELEDEIHQKFSWTYKKHTDKIPSKITVSDIKKAELEGMESIGIKVPPLIKKPDFLEKKESLSAAEKGTILHFFMQHVALDRVDDLASISKQIQEMLEREMLTKEETAVIEPQKVFDFFNSHLGQRLLQSKKVKREVSFVYPVKACDVFAKSTTCTEDVYVQGVIDCYFKENDQYILVDYKTDYVADDETQLLLKYGKQIEIYKEALGLITGKPVTESYLYSFSLDKGIIIK